MRPSSQLSSHRKSWFHAECGCGEINPTAITETTGDRFICGNCEARNQGKAETICANCGRLAPFQNHHVSGWKVSTVIEPWCINCHRILHRGRELRV